MMTVGHVLGAILLLGLVTSGFGAQGQERLALVGGVVIDGTGAPPKADAVILIENGRIQAVGSRSQITIPAGFEHLDVAGLTVLPGLMDSHVHLTMALPRGPKDPDAGRILDEVFDEFLRNGVTSVRDLGGAHPWTTELARSIEEGKRVGPRIFVAGPLLTAPGGHPAGTLLAGNETAIAAATRQIASAEEGRVVVRNLAHDGVDVVKAVLDSRGRSDSPKIPTFDFGTLSAIVEEARAADLPVTVHWSNVSELPAVVAARPTQIEHAGYGPIPDSVIEKIARSGIAVDPTLVANVSRSGPDEGFKSGPLANVRKLHAAGVNITVGTDAPLKNLRFGESLHQELELLVEAGLSPMEAIEAATSRPAGLLKRAQDMGTIEAGKRADLIAVEGEPLREIRSLRNVRLVVRDGRVFHFSPAR